MPKKKIERIKQDIKIKIEPTLPKNKQQYIYVAREKNGNLYYSTVKFHKAKICDKYFGKQEKSEHKNKIFCHRSKDMQAIIYCADFARKLKELKKGEQVRIPINVEKAEVVK